MKLNCPHCGTRNEDEFHYGGDASLLRPPLKGGSEEDWARYIYDRPNPKGETLEYWQHVDGCRQWLIVRRDTRNHDISAIARPMADPADKETPSK